MLQDPDRAALCDITANGAAPSIGHSQPTKAGITIEKMCQTLI